MWGLLHVEEIFEGIPQILEDSESEPAMNSDRAWDYESLWSSFKGRNPNNSIEVSVKWLCHGCKIPFQGLVTRDPVCVLLVPCTLKLDELTKAVNKYF